MPGPVVYPLHVVARANGSSHAAISLVKNMISLRLTTVKRTDTIIANYISRLPEVPLLLVFHDKSYIYNGYGGQVGTPRAGKDWRKTRPSRANLSSPSLEIRNMTPLKERTMDPPLCTHDKTTPQACQMRTPSMSCGVSITLHLIPHAHPSPNIPLVISSTFTTKSVLLPLYTGNHFLYTSFVHTAPSPNRLGDG